MAKFTDKASMLSEAEDLLVNALDLIDKATYGTAAWNLAKSYTIPMIENVIGIGGNPKTQGSLANLTKLVDSASTEMEDDDTGIDDPDRDEIEAYEDDDLAEYDDEEYDEYDDSEPIVDDFSDIEEDGLDPDDDWEDEDV